MHHTMPGPYHKEYTFMNSLEYLNRRLMNEVELSSLISRFHELLFDLFEPQLTTGTMDIFNEIEEYCIDSIKREHKKTEHLSNKELLVWHLSMFMTIQTFIEIVESKYRLDHKKEIKSLFDELLRIDFFKFISLNAEAMETEDITDILTQEELQG